MTKEPNKGREPRKPRITDAERHKRFLQTAEQIGASASADDFERAFDKIVNAKKHEAREAEE